MAEQVKHEPITVVVTSEKGAKVEITWPSYPAGIYQQEIYELVDMITKNLK